MGVDQIGSRWNGSRSNGKTPFIDVKKVQAPYIVLQLKSFVSVFMHLCHMLTKLWNRDRLSAIWIGWWIITPKMKMHVGTLLIVPWNSVYVIKLCLPMVDASTVISTPPSLEGVSSMSSPDVEWTLMWTLSRNDIVPFCLSLCVEGKVELKDQYWESIYTAVSWQSVPPYYYSNTSHHNYHTKYSSSNCSSCCTCWVC